MVELQVTRGSNVTDGVDYPVGDVLQLTKAAPIVVMIQWVAMESQSGTHLHSLNAGYYRCDDYEGLMNTCSVLRRQKVVVFHIISDGRPTN